MLVWSLIIFALYFFGVNALLFRLLRGVNKEGGSEHTTNQNEALGFIYLKYKDEYRNWELVLNFRKCLVVVAQIFYQLQRLGILPEEVLPGVGTAIELAVL